MNLKKGIIFLFFIVSLVTSLSWNYETIFAQQDLRRLVYEVQLNSQKFYDSIGSVRFTGRSKSYVYFDWRAFSLNMIADYEEYIFDGFWMKPDSLRINVKALRIVEPDTVRRTKIRRHQPLPNPFRFSYNMSAIQRANRSFKDSKGDSVAMWPVFPFAMGADSIYNYRFAGNITFRDKRINIIRVDPKYSDIPAVMGTFMIDPLEKIVVGSDVIFNEAAEFNKRRMEERDNLAKYIFGSFNEDRHIKTRKALIHGFYWMPYIVEEEFYVTVIGVKAKVYRVMEFQTYEIDPLTPDTIVFKNRKVNYVIDPELTKELYKGVSDSTKLMDEEIKQITDEAENYFSSLDISTEIFDLENMAQDAFSMRLGKKSGKYLDLAQRLSDNVLYNRVEGLRLDYKFKFVNPVINNLIVSMRAGYGFGDKRYKGEGAFIYFLGEKKKVFLEGSIFNTSDYREDKRLISTGKNTLTCLVDHFDYMDFFYKKGASFGIGYQTTENLALKFSYVSQAEESADNNVKFSIFNWNKEYRLNPDILEGYYRGLHAKIIYKTKNINLNIESEYTDKDFLKSDFSSTILKGDFQWNQKLSNISEVCVFLSGGLSRGSLPPQRWFDFGGKTFINYYGNLRGIPYKYFTGDRMIYGTVEYLTFWKDMFDFDEKQTFIGDLKKLLKFIFWAGIGWSDLSDKSRASASGIFVPSRITDGIYHEFGIGISDRFNLARFDFIRNSLDKNKILISINFMR
ncbi:DUF5686 family protein [candidate division KSB1 bacterium]